MLQSQLTYVYPVHYPTRDLLRRLDLLKQGVTIFIITQMMLVWNIFSLYEYTTKAKYYIATLIEYIQYFSE